MAGNLVYNSALKLMYKNGYNESAGNLIQLYSEVIPGALTEAFTKGNKDYNLYSKIIQRKSVSYDMMLNKVFLRTVNEKLRTNLEKLLAGFSETAQWLNDLMDYEDDKERNQLNVLNCSGISQYSIYGKIALSFYDTWINAKEFNKDLQNSIAARLIDPVNKLINYELN